MLRLRDLSRRYASGPGLRANRKRLLDRGVGPFVGVLAFVHGVLGTGGCCDNRDPTRKNGKPTCPVRSQKSTIPMDQTSVALVARHASPDTDALARSGAQYLRFARGGGKFSGRDEQPWAERVLRLRNFRTQCCAREDKIVYPTRVERRRAPHAPGFRHDACKQGSGEKSSIAAGVHDRFRIVPAPHTAPRYCIWGLDGTGTGCAMHRTKA